MRIYFKTALCLFLPLFIASCSETMEEVPGQGAASASFSLSLNPVTRAAKDLDPAHYDAKVYLYERRESDGGGSAGYTQVQELPVTSNQMTISRLVPLKQYKAVFLAVPKAQTPALPEFMGKGNVPSYSEAAAEYIEGRSSDISNDVFRSIVDFKATTANSQQTTVLTRQNGALEVRLLNQKNLTSVKLHINGHTSFLLHDGTGGQVMTQGTPVALETTLTDPAKLSASEVKIRINLLPQEDLTDKDGTNNYLEVTSGGVTTKYPVKSDHQAIPVYPNQITWLTLGSRDNTNFEVTFSNKINLDDPQWDGIHGGTGENQGQQAGPLEEGYFRATFFADEGCPATRAAISGNSERIQSLLCLIYKKEADGSYTFKEEKEVIRYSGPVGTVEPQTYSWPLAAKVSFDLPNGDYRAVFVGNVQPELFPEQNTVGRTGLEPILTGYKDGFSASRIHMPQKGPAAFGQYNMFYLATVDFNQSTPSPYVLLERIVTSNVYSRTMVDENKGLGMLVDNLLAQIRENQLTTNVVKGLLESNLLIILKPVLGDLTTKLLTPLVDRLVNALLGGVLTALDKLLLDELVKALKASLDGLAGPQTGLLGLGYVLNPWTTTDNADIIYGSMTESINFSRTACTAFKADVEWKGIPVMTDKANNISTISVTCLGGTEQVSKINVGNKGTYPDLLRPILDKLDEKVINGLLINIHTPLKYNMESNLQYTTDYELLDVMLRDYSTSASSQTINVSVQLKDIANLREIVKEILGDGLISGIVGGVTDHLLQPVLDVLLGSTLKIAGIKLPDLGLGNIKLSGTWDAIHVSDGTIAPKL